MILQQLKSKLGDCKFADISDCKGSYEQINESTFYVYDPPPEENKPVRITFNGVYQLIVLNPNKSDVCLVKTDKCLFKDNDPKCDCLLFDNHKFYLVEIKGSSTGTRKDKRNKAIRQLGATIERLNTNNIGLIEYTPEAIICFKSNNIRIPQASFATKQDDFYRKYKVTLNEISIIEF